jgi:hypothetical protein
MVDPDPRATLNFITNTLLISITMLAFGQITFSGEQGRIPRTALVICSIVLQSSCIGVVWLWGGKQGLSTALLILAIAVIVWFGIRLIVGDSRTGRLKR